MPFVGHSKDAYVVALHHIYCLQQTPAEASSVTGINSTVIERAATGWMHGRDGRIGRAVYIYWLRGLRSKDGAPCCGAHVVPGKRVPPRLGVAAAELKRLAELESLVAQAQEQITLVKASMGRGVTTGYEAANDDLFPGSAPTGNGH